MLQHSVCSMSHGAAGVRWSDEQTDHRPNCQIIEVIAHKKRLLTGHVELRLKRFQSTGFVLDSNEAVAYPELTGTHFRGSTLPTAEEGNVKTCLLQQADAKPIPHIKAFGQLSFGIKPKASIGENAIDVKHQQADLSQPFAQDLPAQGSHAKPA